MTDPFVHPAEPEPPRTPSRPSARNWQVFDDWMDRYQYIIELGRTMPAFPASLGQRCAPGARLPEQGVDGSGQGWRGAVARRGLRRGHRCPAWWPCCYGSIPAARQRRSSRRTRSSCATSVAGGAVHQPGQRHRGHGTGDPGSGAIATRGIAGLTPSPGLRVGLFTGAIFAAGAVTDCLPAALDDATGGIGPRAGRDSARRRLAGAAGRGGRPGAPQRIGSDDCARCC